ncbi:3'-5' exonuclease [Heliobacterium chlorum]|uniref:3'-5' exonuclease n=1 Tax=Heliobacterium chlorum TaxID=2698 RepID=A0ABR7T4K7_HELCL|nr:3'-5' exonuclease [Heliobacterium chlorum]MBC9785713.1 3'-5' exonuclease [Heliobacterium chlorum]
MEFIAIDFETANYNRDSACALGIVVVSQHRVIEKRVWLIRPPRLYIHPRFTEIHGIRVEQVRDKPTFGQLWPEISAYLDGRPVVAHNATFDIGVLKAVMNTYQITCNGFPYLCTLAMARKTWPKLQSHKLNVVAEHLGISLQHHDALEDAAAAAGIVSAICQERQIQSMGQLVESLGVGMHNFIM